MELVCRSGGCCPRRDRAARQEWWILYRGGPTEEFARTAKREFDDNDKNDVEQFLPVEGSDKGYAVANGDNGRFALYRYDFKADQLGDLIYENPDYDIDGPVIGARGDVLGVYYTDDRPETAWFDPRISAFQTRIDARLPGMINRILSVSDDRRRVLLWSGSASDPGGYVIFDPGTDSMQLLARTHEALKGKDALGDGAGALQGARRARDPRLSDAPRRRGRQESAAGCDAARRPVRARRMGL